MKLTLIIPAYNESEGVAQTAANLRNILPVLEKTYDVEVIFVNDGSKDNTLQLLTETFAEDKAVRIVDHGVNKGLGAAIRTGFKHATGDIIVTTDFDGTYDFATIPDMLSHMKDGVDVVTASPYHRDGAVKDVPQYRLLFSYGASALYRILVKPNISTWTALFRAYRRPVIENVRFESNDFLAGTELLVKAIQKGYAVAEYPTVLHSRTFGQSSIKIARVTMAHLKFQRTLLQQSINEIALVKASRRVLSVAR